MSAAYGIVSCDDTCRCAEEHTGDLSAAESISTGIWCRGHVGTGKSSGPVRVQNLGTFGFCSLVFVSDGEVSTKPGAARKRRRKQG